MKFYCLTTLLTFLHATSVASSGIRGLQQQPPQGGDGDTPQGGGMMGGGGGATSCSSNLQPEMGQPGISDIVVTNVTVANLTYPDVRRSKLCFEPR